MSMNSDMDRYLRQRRRSKGFYEPAKPFWSDWFIPTKVEAEDRMVLDTIETDIRKGEQQIEAVQEVEHKLEEQQEQRVSLYTKFARMFQREQQVQEEFHEIAQPTIVVHDTTVVDDFRTLAQIQMRWFERMPTRIKEEFKESEDYKTYVEILSRRGVVKRK